MRSKCPIHTQNSHAMREIRHLFSICRGATTQGFCVIFATFLEPSIKQAKVKIREKKKRR
jgi:hypothetical protein